jgi:F420-0:gamma-glutamyl ligase
VKKIEKIQKDQKKIIQKQSKDIGGKEVVIEKQKKTIEVKKELIIKEQKKGAFQGALIGTDKERIL